jgi:UDP-3-O-[3-hydroxymyristoyl] glucosamine N-acyltransferase
MPTINEILDAISNHEYEILSDFNTDTLIDRARPILEAAPNDLTFCSSTATDPQRLLRKSCAGIIIIDNGIPVDKALLRKSGVKVIVFSNNARLDFIRLVSQFFMKSPLSGIHPSSIISSKAIISTDVSIGPLCVIGDTEIGPSSKIYSGTHLYDSVRIGSNVTIHSGCVIGSDGFGYQRNIDGILEKFPHIGGVDIRDDVEIGANTVIDRGALGNTIIGRGSKIGGLVHVAHNSNIGEDVIMAPHSKISGSVVVGDQSWLSPHAVVRDRVTIGANVMVGLGSVVTKNVPDNTTVIGVPAKPFKRNK